jgi:Protein of unknown function (DUF2933)
LNAVILDWEIVMNESHASHQHGNKSSRFKWALLGFVAIAGYFLFTEHKAHVLGVLPYLLLLACPLMHFFMHGRHGGHGEHARTDQPTDNSQTKEHPHA